MIDSSKCVECGKSKEEHIRCCPVAPLNAKQFRPAEPESHRRSPDHTTALDYAGEIEFIKSHRAEVASSPKPAPPDYKELLGEIDKWCSGENQVDDGEDAEDALRYIRDAIRAFLAGAGSSPSEPFMSADEFSNCVRGFSRPDRITLKEACEFATAYKEAYAEYLER